MKNTSPNFPVEPEKGTHSSENESMEDLLNRVTKLAMDSLSELSKKETNWLP